MTAIDSAALAALSAADRETFVARLGAIFEHSPWIAAAAWSARPFADLEALHAAMVRAIELAPRAQQLALIRSHPELAGKEAAAGTLTSESTQEQASVGLDRCTAEELAQVRQLNQRYRERHGFPFVIAVRGLGKDKILAALEARANKNTEIEVGEALQQIARIGRLRLEALLAK